VTASRDGAGSRGEHILREANAAWAAIIADPAARAEVEAERTLWDATLADGLESEDWRDDAGAGAGEIWWASLDPVIGHEQAGTRPVLIVSADTYTQGPLGLVVILPMTRRIRPFPLHIAVQPVETGLASAGAIMCEQPRVIAQQRLLNQRAAGRLNAAVMDRGDRLLKAVLDLS